VQFLTMNQQPMTQHHFDTLDTAQFLREFKEKYLSKVVEHYERLKLNPKADAKVLEDAREKVSFLSRFVASVEAEIERAVLFRQNLN